ncbi:hypothetical protein C2S51_018047 [Perilla frutescens var. frutescens]|nr:hypothetical protein C2S51_018047 [Perilla frutescens var. frutescens]
MGEAAISSAVQILGNLLIEKVKFLQAVSSEVELLKDELKRMQCFLKDAADKRATNESVRNWISDIRKVAYDAEDVIEIFILRVESARKNRGLLMKLSCFRNHIYNLDRVGEEIRLLQARLEKIDRSRERYGITDLGERVDWTDIPDHIEWQRRLVPTEEDKDVVGLEKDLVTLLEKAILDERKDPFNPETGNLALSSATIMGMAGIGKSTLARMVYNHYAVVEHFDERAWVVVSNECRPREVMKELILQLLDPSEDKLKVLEIMKELKAPRLQRMVEERLKDKRYLVVLDDVWEDAHWASLADAFPNNDKGSRLLLTSRSGVSTEYTRYTHPMKILNLDESRELFLKKALTDNTGVKCPEELKEIGRKILENCGGLPLAINVVGALLLKGEQSKSGWEKVLKGIKFYLGRNGVVSDILELSYQNLPPQLKPCFLCLAFFNDNAIIPAKKLKNVWIAQGFIQQEGEQTVEVIATRYLDELINRNMIQVKDMTKDHDQIKNCQVHDLIRELSIKKAEEEMGFEIIRGGEGNSQSSDKPRHRALHCGGRFIDGKNCRNKHLRCLFIYGYDDGAVIGPSSYWKAFELLRVLEMEGCTSLITLPEAIGSFIGLRYMGLRKTQIKKLPFSFRKLKNLQILELPSNFPTPSFIWELESLRHMYALPNWPKPPPKISILNSLHTVKYLLLSEKSNFEQLAEMNNICYLGIVIDSTIDLNKLFSSFRTLKNLVRLSLRWHGGSSNLDSLSSLCHITRLKLHGQMSRLPTGLPPNLSHFTLKGSILDKDPMPLLEKLPCLSYLALFKAYLCQSMVISGGGFPTLKFIGLRQLSELSIIQVGEGAMPELKRVEITSCPDLKTHLLQKQLGSSVAIDLRMLFD